MEEVERYRQVLLLFKELLRLPSSFRAYYIVIRMGKEVSDVKTLARVMTMDLSITVIDVLVQL